MLHHPANCELKLLIIGDYLFEPQSGLLSGPSGAHHMCSQMSVLLCRLIERAGEVVDRESLILTIWPDTPQGAQRLVSCIGRLRAYFDDSARSASYIETVNGHGYKLVAPVYGSTHRPVVVTPSLHDEPGQGPGGRLYRLFREFKQRKVCRSLLIYTIVMWLVFQVTDVVVEPLSLPDWFASMVIMLGLLGFPVAATLAWIFDLTPSGLVRDAGPAQTARAPMQRRWTDFALDTTMIVIALLICGMLLAGSFNVSFSTFI
jgi:DNA-binding winged helix-turn-helix (wHTH) protein